MVLVDTNIAIPLLVEHPLQKQIFELFHRDSDWHLPDWWQIELANVLRNYHRAGLFDTAEILEIQHRSTHLFPSENTHPVDLSVTLRIACEENISAYDARFIALARSFGQPLVTEDQCLRKACPDDTVSLEQALA